MNSRDNNLAIPDVQSSEDTRRMPINRVGIKDIRHPVKVLDKDRGVQHTIASFNMYVGLPHNFKGTHMSRFVEILNSQSTEISVESFETMLREMVVKLEAETGHLEMSFPFFINKTAPVSGVKSLCPCSKEISDYGAHNQRSLVTLRVEVLQPLPWEALVRFAEEAASSEIWPMLKRPDEKWVTERAYENPKFVEDLVRDVALALNADPRIGRYVAEVENFESIHNHSAYARIER